MARGIDRIAASRLRMRRWRLIEMRRVVPTVRRAAAGVALSTPRQLRCGSPRRICRSQSPGQSPVLHAPLETRCWMPTGRRIVRTWMACRRLLSRRTISEADECCSRSSASASRLPVDPGRIHRPSGRHAWRRLCRGVPRGCVADLRFSTDATAWRRHRHDRRSAVDRFAAALAACGESRSTSPILLAKGSTGSSAALTLWRMTMGTRDPEQPPLWIATSDLPVSPGHPFYTRLNALLDADSTRS